MTIESLQAQLTDALKAKDEQKASVVRMLVAAIHNKEIELHGKGGELSEKDVDDVLKKELKKRKEAAAAYKQAGRNELAEKESAEAAFIENMLPEQMSEADIEKIVDETLAELGPVSQADFGKIMKAVMAKAGGQAEGGMVSGVIKKRLS